MSSTATTDGVAHYYARRRSERQREPQDEEGDALAGAVRLSRLAVCRKGVRGEHSQPERSGLRDDDPHREPPAAQHDREKTAEQTARGRGRKDELLTAYQLAEVEDQRNNQKPCGHREQCH